MWQHLYTEQHVSTSAWLTYSREEEVNAYLQGQMCCVDERDRVQKKTFTKWVNKHLMKAQQSVDDLYEDLRDGHNLISLLEVLSGDSLPREKGRMRFHKLQNVGIALEYLKHRQVRLVNIRNDDIADGNPKLTLGLIWTIILHFQISDIQVSGQSEDMTAKEKLLLWSQRMVEGYPGLRCDNFSSSWRDGKLFNAVIHRHRPTLIDMNKVYRQRNVENLEQAFTVAEHEFGVTRLLDPEDVDVPHPDEKSIITYVSSLYDAVPRVPDVQDGVKANETQLCWQEYYELVTILIQWIRHHIVTFEERRFPGTYEEMEVLWRQFLKFKETELPAKELDKTRSKAMFRGLESAVQEGHLKIPVGYHPIDVEKEWGKLHVSLLERERVLRIEFERLERFQRIVSKIQVESGVCEEQLKQCDSLLKTDITLLNAGKAPQSSAVLHHDLDKADSMIRLLFNDVQTLKDARHPQAEPMYRRVFRLHELLVAIRTDYSLRFKSGAQTIQQVTVSSTFKGRSDLDHATLRYVQDLLAWVEENQKRIDGSEWGVDLPTVESQLGSHRGLHQSIEDFRAKIERARTDEGQLSSANQGSYRDYLGKLDLQYAKLLNTSKSRLRNLESLNTFVSMATKELMWLNDKEEEEVNCDWSERNNNMAAKKDNYSGLMKELEVKEKKVNSIQNTGDKLLREGHPGKQTIEAFMAALQTQWSWILQLCCCIEAHLKENTAYFQFFSDVRDANEYLKKMEESMKKKYSCDRSVTVTRLQDLLQDASDEKEALTDYKEHLSGLSKRAKTIVQLKPRSAACPLASRTPTKAVCDYRQMEITVHKGDEYSLLNNSQPYKWKVVSASGGEAVVPSVCFNIPPPNRDALDSVTRLDSMLQGVLTLWHHFHVDMKTLLSWLYLQRDIHQIRSWTLLMLRSLSAEEYKLLIQRLEVHYQDFLRESQDSHSFGPEDRIQMEKDYKMTIQHYEKLLRSLEKDEEDESSCQTYISQLKDIRLHLESCETRTIQRLRLPLDKEPLQECTQRLSDQQKIHSELDSIKRNLKTVNEKTELVLSMPDVGSGPALRSALDITQQKMERVYSLSTVYLEKLKTVEVVIRSTEGAEKMVKKYEDKLRNVNTVPSDTNSLESYKKQLKELRAELERQQPQFDTLDTELSKARAVNERMIRSHSERDVDLERFREWVQQLLERWQGVHTQTETRARDLEQLGRQLHYYRDSYQRLMSWIEETKQRQEQLQSRTGGKGNHVSQQLLQQRKLMDEIEKKKEKVDECERFAKQYIDAIKDYELQLVTYKAQVEPVTSPVKKPKVQSASDTVIQEYVELRTRYIELMTLCSQYIRFLVETQSRLEQEEKTAEKLKAEERRKLEEVEAELEKQRQLAQAHAKAKAQAEREAKELQLKMEEEVSKREIVAVDAQQQKQNIQQQLQQLRQSSETEIQNRTKIVEETLVSRTKIEEEIRVIRLQLEASQKQKAGAESEVQQLRSRAEEADKQRRVLQDEAERLRKQVNEEAQRKKQAEEELKVKVQAESEAAREKRKALEDLQHFKNMAAEAERKMKQAEVEKERQIQLAHDVAQKSAVAELQNKRMSFEQKTSELEMSLKQEHLAVTQLQEEASRLKRQQEEADRAREEAEKELEKWQQKANEALRQRLQAEEVAHKKTLAQEEAEKQKEEADREARRRAKTEESAVRQKEMAEEELEKQRRLAEETAQQKLTAEQELIRLRAETENGEQQRILLEDELYRLKNEVTDALRQRKTLEEELAKVRAEMELLLQNKVRAEEESRSNSEKTKQMLESEATKMKGLAEEAAKLRAVAEEAKRQRQAAQDEVVHQRGEADRILKEKLMAITEATRLKTEAEMALKEKEAENERLRRLAEDEAYQRKALEEQAEQHKKDIEERIGLLRKSSDMELERQKTIVEETLKHRRIIEEEIRILKVNFEKASEGKSDLEIELGKLKSVAEETQQSKESAEAEAERQRALVQEEAKKRQEAERKVKEILAAEQEAARQRKTALEEVGRLKNKAEEAWRQKELAETEATRQISLAQEAAQKRLVAEEKAHQATVQQKEEELQQSRMQEQTTVGSLREQAEQARRLAEEAEQAKFQAEQEAAHCRQQAEEAERLKQQAEKEAAKKAQDQSDAERLRKEAELEAAKRAQAEQTALRLKEAADADMEKHKKFAEQTLRQKSAVEAELTKVKVQLEDTDHQKSVLEEERQRLKTEVGEAMKQKNQAEEELFKVKIQMEELVKLKRRIEEENKVLMMKDKDKTQRHLEEEAERMKQLAEEAARLSVEAQESARQRKMAEEDLSHQRALADKMLKEKMQAMQEATQLRAEAELLQRQRDQAEEQAQKLSADKRQMQERLAAEAEEYQKTLEAERRRQAQMSEESERLKDLVSELTQAQAKAEQEAERFRKEANSIGGKLRETEEATREKNDSVRRLEMQVAESDQEASGLREAIAELEREKIKLKQEAELLHSKAKEMESAQKQQIVQETHVLQQTFLTEKDVLLKKEKMIEEEKIKLELLYEEELGKSTSLRHEQDRQMSELEEEKRRLQESMTDALRKQREAEEQARRMQSELQEREKQRQDQEKALGDENKALRDKLQQLELQKAEAEALRKTTDIVDGVEFIRPMVIGTVPTVSNGREAAPAEPDRFSFQGLRRPVSADRLHRAGVISKKLLEKLKKETVSVQELAEKDNVKGYLEGKSSVAGLLLQPNNQKMSIYQAMKKGLLNPNTAATLLEAQAASGFIIDPIKNQKLSVNEAIKENVVGPEFQDKLLSAERAVTGYKDPYTGNTISLFQAMKKDLIVKEHGIRLLEAQIATGGIIDPVNSHRLPLHAAYKEGLFDEEMNRKLGEDSDEVKGFVDPNTQDNLTYAQLKERCKKDPDTGLYLLPLTEQALKGEQGYTTEQTQDVFSKATISVPGGRFSGKTITIWELINSEYFTEEQRRDLIRQYRSGRVTIEKIIKFIITIIDETETKKQLLVDGLRDKVPASKLLEAKIIDKKTFEELQQGKKRPEEVEQVETVKKYLKGSDSIAGVFVEPTKETLNIYEAMKKNLLRPGTAELLLEAQAASGFIIDPVKNLRLSVDEAVKMGVVGPELHEKLLYAERAVTGYKDPYTGNTISLFQAMKKSLLLKDHGVRLLQAQLASGGVIDPENSHRLPLDVAYTRGMLDEETNKMLSDNTEETKGFTEPNTEDRVSYQQLKDRCTRHPQTGFCLLPLTEETVKSKLVYDEEQTKNAFGKNTVSVPSGKFSGKTITIWELIHSEYFTEEQRRDLIRQYRSGKVTVEKIIKIVITIIEETETKKKPQITLDGLREKVPASELLEAKIIDKKTFEELQQGKKRPEEVEQVETVKKYLKDSDSIAGVFVEPTKETLNIYEAMKKNLLRPGTAELLLEAQAASGFIIDPVKNLRLSVDEAVKKGVIGPELHEKLLSAEKAVTGYKDPYTGNTISLFQAMKKNLLLKEHSVRLLQAQLASGGVIDPGNSHRLPLDVAYERDMLDEETNKMLSDNTEETKGFTEPNTEEKISYQQLKDRCRRHPKTGFCLVPLSEKTVKTEDFHSEELTKDVFKKATVDVPSGKFSSRTVTIWELINSEYFTEEQRKELIRQYRSGKVTVEKIITIVITIIEETETKKKPQITLDGLREKVLASELLEAKIIDKKTFEELLQGKKRPEEVEQVETVKKYLKGSDSIAGILDQSTNEKMSIYEALKRNLLQPSTAEELLEAQAACAFLIDPVKNQKLSVNEAIKAGVVGPELHGKLLSAEKAATGYRDPYTGTKISLFQAMKKDLVLKKQGTRLLEAQMATGGIIDPVNSHRLPLNVAFERNMLDEETNRKLSDPSDEAKGFSDPNTQERVSYRELLQRCTKEPGTGLSLLPLRSSEKPRTVETTIHTETETRQLFEDTSIEIPAGLQAGSSMSLWEVMNSELLSEEEKRRLTMEYRSGKITRERLVVIIIEILQQIEIRSVSESFHFSGFWGKVSAEELFASRIIDQETFNLLREHRKTVQEVCEMETVRGYLLGTGVIAGIYVAATKETLSLYQAMKKGLVKADAAIALLEAQAATGAMVEPATSEHLNVDEAVRRGVVGPELHDALLSAERAVTGYKDPYTGRLVPLFQAMKKQLIVADYATRLLEAQLSTGGIVDPEHRHRLPLEVAYQRGCLDKETQRLLTDPAAGVKGFSDPNTEERLSYRQLLGRCRPGPGPGLLLLPLSDKKKLMFKGLRKQITMEELVQSNIIEEATVLKLESGLTTVEEVSNSIRSYLEGTSCIAGVYVEATKERLSIYQAMKKGMIRPGTAFELLEAQAATGYLIDPIKNRKLPVLEAVQAGVVGVEFRDKLLSAEKAVTGYQDPYTGTLMSLFQAMQKGLILKDHGIRLLESQIATGGIIDPEYSHRLPVEVAYQRGLFDEEMNQILSDPGDDTKGFFDPNTEENLTYLQLMEKCIKDPITGLCLLSLKEKKRERKTSSKSSVRKRRVVIVDPENGKEMSVYEAYRKGLIDHQTYMELSEQECEWEEVTISSSDGVVKSIITDRRSGRQYDIDDALGKGLIDQGSLDLYRSGTLSITEFADMLSGNMGGFRSRSSSIGSTSSFPISPQSSPMKAQWQDPTEETGPIAGILDTDTLDKLSITEAMHRNLVDNITGQRFLEAQACTGGIIDPNTGERFSVTEAVGKGLVDKIMVDRINLAQKAFNGFEDPRTKTKMSAAQALKKGWLYYEAGQRFLEIQYLTGGLIEPNVVGRVSLEEALQKGTIDLRTAQKLRDVHAYVKYITCPKTKLKISYKDAMDRSMVEEGTSVRLLEASSQSTKGFYSPYSVSGAGSASGSRSGSRTGSRTGSRRGSFDATGSSYSMSFSSSSLTSYGRRLAGAPGGGSPQITDLSLSLAAALNTALRGSCQQGQTRQLAMA
ncbi:plectin isoform X2 [Callorhinchus milii]|uniref:plectin isoform X2 n=1 Tax=Callorhinchus milii TaxID=7868 RepID=UPI001C3FC359|nr:plectin isoform X2 [Callorhinchus milii]